MIRQVNREMVLLLGGGRALLMQLAHPAVAAGVADHSHFRQEPLRRLWRTMDTMWAVVFGDSRESSDAVERVAEIHERVHGNRTHHGAVKSYDARDPRLLLWVHATLVDSALAAYDLFVRRLSPDGKNAYYDDMKRFGCLFGIPKEMMPRSLADFYVYMSGMIGGGEIAVSETARGLAKDILRPRPWVLKPGAPLQNLVTAGLLPGPLRAAYGLEWNERRETKLRWIAGAIRGLLPIVPKIIRVVPRARAAEKEFRRVGSFFW